MQLCTRFAPSPSGLLHVGNAYSALCCARWAKTNQTELLLRIEDIDTSRCHSKFTAAILEDLRWLGLNWPEPVRLQSQHLLEYQQTINQLREMDMIYPCFCSRKSIRLEMERMGIAPHAEDKTALYPGICRGLGLHEQEKRMRYEPFAWRLDIQKAMKTVPEGFCWLDGSGNSHIIHINHDVIIGRKDISFSYHLSVVIDDAAQNISHVIRGEDLQGSTGIHCLLQNLLGLHQPTYIHHSLLCDTDGERLAKRHGATTLRSLREAGINPDKLQDYLFHHQKLIWPFKQNDDEKILDQFGDRP
jgi:glutamyl-Q tRNA(Asp) synthetase